jgi:hypothetical protein
MSMKKLLASIGAKHGAAVPGLVLGNQLVEQLLKAQEANLQVQQQQLEVQRQRLRALNELVETNGKRPRPDKWQVASSITTVFALIASIAVAVFVYRQTQVNAALQDQGARYSSISQMSLEVDKVIASNPKLVPCFRDGDCPPDLSPVERRQAQELAGYIVDFYQYLDEQLISLGYGPQDGRFVLRGDPGADSSDENWITWGETIVMGFRNSRMVCDSLIAGRDAYSVRFVNAVASRGVCDGLQPV